MVFDSIGLVMYDDASVLGLQAAEAAQRYGKAVMGAANYLDTLGNTEDARRLVEENLCAARKALAPQYALVHPDYQDLVHRLDMAGLLGVEMRAD